jgi:hypothetical protein
MFRRGLVAAFAMTLVGEPARADRGTFARLANEAHHALARELAAKSPKLVPPVPVKVTWKAVRIGSIDVGGPLVALGAADLDSDGKAELYAVTTREVVAIGAANKKTAELGRVAYTGAAAVPASRDPVGAITVEKGEVVASTSAWDVELRVSRQGTGNVLVGKLGSAGSLVCPGERLMRVPGRNHFGDLQQPLYGVRCANLVDPLGAPIVVRGALLGTKLEVSVDRCTQTGCLPVAKHELKDYGSAFAIADVDRDGKPEVIVSGAGAPGDADAVKVITLGGDEKKGIFRRTFNGGVVGIVVADADGDGSAEVIAAVRLAGATRVDLWRLD